MHESQPSSTYRQKAAELRAAADRSSNFSIRCDLLDAADNYDRLADFAEKEAAPSPH